MASPLWRQLLLPASFRGVPFHVEGGAKQGGRRTVTHEYPKRDDPYTEDMGRRARKFSISAYVIGDEYTIDSELLAAALDTEGGGTLIHPTMGIMNVVCDGYSRSEQREEGGMARFEILLVEAGTSPYTPAAADTQSATSSAADSAGSAAATAADTTLTNTTHGVTQLRGVGTA
ncbi:DNA circularization N-terminal domain-containing protein [Rhizobium sp. SG741]|uniref:DNA circularization N-terminal domain-containing protein n=1 Tax=Rhizobium sp. SG741 TaxID=2587114 RepID=UPI00144776FE|nr:DNA circularization N-terminal domain-containing protein [Rhizobium sp. SG741]NKJ03139.1 prophage DNA circulation protein [Rhizobium sp. SG741]